MEQEKIKNRIRKAIREKTHISRVYFQDDSTDSLIAICPQIPKWGIYKLVHYEREIPFRIDKIGRIYLYS